MVIIYRSGEGWVGGVWLCHARFGCVTHDEIDQSHLIRFCYNPMILSHWQLAVNFL